MTDNNAAAIKILADALGVEPDNITPDTALGVSPQWDSLAHMRIILSLEKALGQQMAPMDILTVAGFQDVIALLDKA